MVVSTPARYMVKGCSQCSDSALGPVGTFVFVLGWVGYQGSTATRRWWFDKGRAGVGIFPSARGRWVILSCDALQYTSQCVMHIATRARVRKVHPANNNQ